MTEYPHSVVLERSVYVGGGYAVYGDGEYCMQVFNMDAEKWSRLPRYRYRYFAMTVINYHLTLVGGRGGGSLEVTNQLAVYKPLSQHWTFPYNPCPHLITDQVYSCMTYGCWWQVGVMLASLT